MPIVPSSTPVISASMKPTDGFKKKLPYSKFASTSTPRARRRRVLDDGHEAARLRHGERQREVVVLRPERGHEEAQGLVHDALEAGLVVGRGDLVEDVELHRPAEGTRREAAGLVPALNLR